MTMTPVPTDPTKLPAGPDRRVHNVVMGLFRRLADSHALAGGHTHTYNSANPFSRCETDDCPVLRVFARQVVRTVGRR
jgi:hypothetical protein